MLDDTMHTTRNGVDSVKGRRGHGAASTRRTVLRGVRAAATVFSIARALQLGKVLGLLKLARGRSTAGTLVLLGTGFAAGAGACLLLAPMTGRDLRRAIMDRLPGLFEGIGDTAAKVEREMNDAEGTDKKGQRVNPAPGWTDSHHSWSAPQS